MDARDQGRSSQPGKVTEVIDTHRSVAHNGRLRNGVGRATYPAICAAPKAEIDGGLSSGYDVRDWRAIAFAKWLLDVRGGNRVRLLTSLERVCHTPHGALHRGAQPRSLSESLPKRATANSPTSPRTPLPSLRWMPRRWPCCPERTPGISRPARLDGRVGPRLYPFGVSNEEVRLSSITRVCIRCEDTSADMGP
jgi:hypothetical protein